MKRIAEASPLFKARIAGAVFVLGLLSAVLGEFFVRKLEIAADLIAVSCMIAVTLLLYGIFKPVNRGLSLLAASFNLVGLTFGALRWNPRGVDMVPTNSHHSASLIDLQFRDAVRRAALGVKNQLFVKNGRGEPFCSRRLRGCLPLKSLNPYSRAASAAMITLPDFDINCRSEYNEATARPVNLGVS